MQSAGLKGNAANIKVLIGLMCSECFVYEGLIKEIQEKLGIKPAEIKKMNIKGKMWITTEQGTKAISLVDVKKYARTSCRLCEDFSSEFADISAGGIGLEGWTLAIIRTGIGETLFSKASRVGVIKEAEPNEGTLRLLYKLSTKKAKSLSEQNRD
jgi:coenzyme F420 hydrogenase subunit beta